MNKLPFYIFDVDKNKPQFKIQLHGFSDASLQLYEAVFIRDDYVSQKKSLPIW